MTGSLSDRYHLQSKVWWQDWGLTLGLVLLVLLGESIFAVRFLRFPLTEELYRGDYLWKVFGVGGLRRPVLWAGLLVGCCVIQYLERITIKDLHPFSRVIFVTIVLVQTYSVGLIDYNHLFDSWFAVDRVLLFAFAALAILRPVFLPFFLLQLILLTGQLRVTDYIGYDHVHKFIAVPLLTYAWMLTIGQRFIRVERGGVLFGTFALAVLALWYIFAGWGKYIVDWQEENSLYFLYAAAVDVGWLEGWSETWRLRLGQFLRDYETPLLYGTLLVEIILPILLFTRRWLALLTGVMLLGFHLSVYLFSGILFWQWSLIELVFIGFLWLYPSASRALFERKQQVTYLALLCLVPLFTHIGSLAWFDCGYINKYTFYLLDREGEAHRLDATYFSPYDTGFAKNRFFYSSNFRTLANTYGQCEDLNLLRTMRDWERLPAVTRADSLAHLRAGAYERYDAELTATYHDFLTDFVANKNAYDPQLISRFSSPPHMQQGPDQRNFQVPDLVGLRVVYEEKIILPDLQYQPIRSDTVFLPLNPSR